MGYTHYFTNKEYTDEEWNALLEDVRLLLKNLPKHTDTAGGYHKRDPLQLANWAGEPNTTPDLTNDHNGAIRLNGLQPLDHETFHIAKGGDREFCKTARKPYDLVCCAILILANHLHPDKWDIGSDGDPADWEPARVWASEVLGVELKIPEGVKG